jgi:PAS domain S-box-containing protein
MGGSLRQERRRKPKCVRRCDLFPCSLKVAGTNAARQPFLWIVKDMDGGMSLRATHTGDEDRYRVLVEAITNYAIYMLDPSGMVQSWNAGAERFQGYSSDEIIGRHFARFYTGQDRASGLPARALEISAREGKFESDGLLVGRNGTRFWAHVVIEPIHGSSGELIGFAIITRDRTERRKAEEELRNSQEQFQRLVQGVTDYAIYMLDPEGIITSWNPGAERINGYFADEIVG